jgi:uncharacterized membrane protein YkoI
MQTISLFKSFKSIIKNPVVIGSVLSIGFLITTMSIQAKDIKDPALIAQTAQSAGLISLEEAKQKALAVKPGKVKEVELEKRKMSDGWDYEVEIIDANGQEWDVDIDAKTGTVLKVKLD